ncbi:hypothetical protein P4639_21980 [Priestia megaterium]|uniref:hypothetical protein n=1 Tax=Priestia megaterium TaxID=1404 RepID=UPI002E2101B9|nr:hypothetical protein [Priestia megaterium]
MTKYIMDEIKTLEHDAVKMGYANIFHEYMVYVRAGMLNDETVKDIADALHETPVFLADDLKGFNHEYFWNEINKASVRETLFGWFKVGVASYKMKKDYLNNLK